MLAPVFFLALFFHTLTDMDVLDTRLLVIKYKMNVKRLTLERDTVIGSPLQSLAFHSYLDGRVTRQGRLTLKLS